MSHARSVPSLLALALSGGLVACGGDVGDGADPDGGGGGGGPDAGSDLGGWRVERATTTDGTISHDGALAVLADGTVWMAFAEPDTDGNGGNIFVASRDQVGWSTATALTTDPVQQAFPAMSADADGAIDLVWSGRLAPEDFNDLFYARYENGAWSDRVNLTAAFEGDVSRHAYQPVVARKPTGELAIAYLSGVDIGDAEVRVGVLDGGALVAAPASAIAPGQACDDPGIAVDQAGIVHVVASCGPLFQGDIYYSNDSGSPGTFAAASPLPNPDGQDDVAPAIAIAGDGFSAIAAWATGAPCGEDTCGEILVSTRSGGGFGAPVEASGGGDTSEASPVLGVGGDGAVHVAFHRFNAANYADIVVASGDGATFVETVLTPGTDASDEWIPYGMTIAPTGEPHFTFVQILSGTDPLNTEVWHAWRE